MSLSSFIRELRDCIRLFSKKNKEIRSLSIYSESSVYYLYYEGIVDSILEKSDIDICYITSDENDEIFKKNDERIHVFYVNKLLPFVTPFLDSKVLIMTMPDLNQYHIKRSTNKDVRHIYVFHAIISTHMIYRLGAFDYYDTIFCVGPHHEREIRRMEELYDLPQKELVEVGYHLLEKIHQEHHEFIQNSSGIKDDKKIVLIAPSWNVDNIMEVCIDPLLDNLIKNDYKVIVRPHPEYVKRNKEKVNRLIKQYGQDIELELKITSNVNLHKAEVLITDWSGIAYEYAFGTERPVLFIDTPKKINNPDYEKLEIQPLEVQLREVIGEVLPMDSISEVSEKVDKLIADRIVFREKIITNRQKNIFNWGKSSNVSSEFVINQIVKKNSEIVSEGDKT